MSRSAYVTLGGGIDLVTPQSQLSPGAALYCINYECPITGGYRRIDGYTQQGPVVPGEGPLLGVVTFIDQKYAVRKDVDADAATLYRLNTETTTWDAISPVHNGRHEFVEGNVYATESGRCLYGVGGGKPFELMAEPFGETVYVDLVELTADLIGHTPEGVTYTADGDLLEITDENGRAITAITVADKAGATLLSPADVPAGDDPATAETVEPTTATLDFTSIDINAVGWIEFTVGEEAATTLTVPELIGPFTVLEGAQSGAKFIAIHQEHLFLGFEPGSLQHSGIGDPTIWDAATGGAGEIGVGQRLTGLVPGTGGVLHVLCRDSVQTLYGSSSIDWELRVTAPGSGARAYSAQSLMVPNFVAERGITSLAAVQEYGDFQAFYPGRKIETLFSGDGLANRVVASGVSKTKAQYRVWFDNGTGIYMSRAGLTTVKFPDQVAVAHSGELEDGTEQLLIGDDQGFVHRLDNNAISFNSTPIKAFLTLAYADLKQPNVRKRFRRVFWDIRSGTDAQVSIQTDYDHGRNETSRPRREFVEFMLGGGLWGVDRWNEFVWSVPWIGQDAMEVAGTGTNINFSIYSDLVCASHELLGYDLHYDIRRQRRG